MPELARIRVYPIKSLGAVERDHASITGDGRLDADRVYAVFDGDGNYVNGRRNEAIHRLQTKYDIGEDVVQLRADGESGYGRFALEGATGRRRLESKLGEYFGEPVGVRKARDDNFTDGAGGLGFSMISTTGPSVLSTATIREVASWFPELGVEEIRRRFRPNLEIGGVEPFWEDQLFAGSEHAVEFHIGDVVLYGVKAIPRCVVPTRDPDTGEQYPGFAERFCRKREETFPDTVDESKLGENVDVDTENFFYLAVNTRIPRSMRTETLRVGDRVEISGKVPILQIH